MSNQIVQDHARLITSASLLYLALDHPCSYSSQKQLAFHGIPASAGARNGSSESAFPLAKDGVSSAERSSNAEIHQEQRRAPLNPAK